MGTRKIIRKCIAKYQDELISLRRDFHAYPEKGFEEVRTCKKIYDYLVDCGIEVKQIAKTGVIGTLRGDDKGKVIALRADMDGLPVIEENDVSYKSKNDGLMHACGHDGHVAILLGVAKYLSERKDKLKGTVRFIFQPGEEGYFGAVSMIEEGALEDPKPEAVFGLHLWNSIEIGEASVECGPIMANTCEFKVKIIGKGGHGAKPNATIDSVVVAAQFVTTLQTAISRSLDPFEPGVVTIGTIEGGTNYNVIAPSVKLTGTMRGYSDEVINLLKTRVNEILDGVCKSFGAEFELEFRDGYPALYNDEDLSKLAKEVSAQMLGEKNVRSERSMGGEDFAYYAQKVPACFIFVGAGNKNKGIIYPNHHPRFDLDEDSLLIGMDLLLRIADKFL